MSTSPKEIIKNNIRNALNKKAMTSLPAIDLNQPLFPNLCGNDFVERFRANGGKCVTCKKEELMPFLIRFLQERRYQTIFNNCPSLSAHLKNNGIFFSELLSPTSTPDIAIALADHLLVRSGSLVFSQKFMRYPSIRNIAPNILVIGFVSSMVPDLKEVLADSQRTATGMLEIITPEPLEIIDGQSVATQHRPQFYLLLVG